MAKKTKKASWLYIALGAVVGLGAVMGVSRLLSDDKSEVGVDLKNWEVDVQGYELVLTEEDPDKILEICRSAMDNSDFRWIEKGYTYDFMASYSLCCDGQCTFGEIIEIFYDYSENAEDDKFIISVDGREIVTVDQLGISKNDYTMQTATNENDQLLLADWSEYKVVYGHRDALNEDEDGGYVDGYSGWGYLPDEIVNLVRLVAPAD